MDFKQTIMAGLGIAACTLASAKNIYTYNKLVASLRAGVSVSAVIDIEKCHYADNEKNTWEEKTLGARFSQIYERVAEDIEQGKKMRLVATSHHSYVGKESVIIVRTLYRIFEDGTTEVITQRIDPVTYKVIKNTMLFCRLTSDSSSSVSLVTTEK
jgi:hypothetical protein